MPVEGQNTHPRTAKPSGGVKRPLLDWILELGRQITVDFKTDADLNESGGRPGHRILQLYNWLITQ